MVLTKLLMDGCLYEGSRAWVLETWASEEG
jgi:hypothetical protein